MKSPETPLWLLTFVLFLGGANLRADDFTVSNNSDSGPGSLRQAIFDAVNHAGDDRVVFDSNLPDPTITLDPNSGDLLINDPSGAHLDIDASNLTEPLTISGGGACRIFAIISNSRVTLRNLVITQGQPDLGDRDGHGGGIYLWVDAELTIEDCVISENAAADRVDQPTGAPNGASGEIGRRGGGIYARGKLTVYRSRILNNRAGNGGAGGDANTGGTSGTGGEGGAGGGIYATDALTIVDSEIDGNRSGAGGDGGSGTASTLPGADGGRSGEGGGVFTVSLGAPLIFERVTFSNNFSEGAGNGGSGSVPGDGGYAGFGGGMRMNSESAVVFRNVTFSGNSTGNGGNGGSTKTPGNDGGNGRDGGRGGALYANAIGSLTFTHVTMVDNICGVGGLGGDSTGGGGGSPGTDGGEGIAGGAGIEPSVTEFVLENTVVAGNTGQLGPDIWGTVTELNGVNFIGDTQGVNGLDGSELTGDPMMEALADNGGIGKTLKPGVGSPLNDGGGTLASPLATDQRGMTRPLGNGPEIGAVEVIPPFYQPDNRIGKKSNPFRHKGNNVYNNSGGGQKLKLKLKKKRPGKAFLSIQNDGNSVDSLSVRANRPNRKVRLKIIDTTHGGGNVTAAVTRGGKVFSNLAPGQFGGLKVIVKARSLKKKARLTQRYSSVSLTNGAKQDTAKLKAKGKKKR